MSCKQQLIQGEGKQEFVEENLGNKKSCSRSRSRRKAGPTKLFQQTLNFCLTTLEGAVTLSCCSNDNISVSFKRPLFFLSAKINISFNHLLNS